MTAGGSLFIIFHLFVEKIYFDSIENTFNPYANG